MPCCGLLALRGPFPNLPFASFLLATSAHKLPRSDMQQLPVALARRRRKSGSVLLSSRARIQHNPHRPHHHCPRARAGYVWNGLVHQSRAKALAGSAAVAAAATLLHAALPTFEADKALLGTLLDLDLLEDPRGAIRARVDAPPVLPPFSLAGTRAALGALALRVLPVREVSDAEFEAMRELNPPMVLPPRCAPAPLQPAAQLRRTFQHIALISSSTIERPDATTSTRLWPAKRFSMALMCCKCALE